MDRIDGHVHIDGTFGQEALLNSSINKLFEEMDQIGLQRAVIMPNSPEQSNEMIGELCRQYPDRLIGFCWAEFFTSDWKGYIDRFKHYIEDLGFRGLKIHPRYHGISLRDTRVSNLVALAGKYSVPVIFDCLPSRGRVPISETLPLLIDELAFDNPDTKIIIAHLGGHRLLDSYAVVKNNSNTYLDLSTTIIKYQGSSVITDLSFVIKELAPMDRLIFGSDFPTFSIVHTYKLYQEIFRNLNITDSQQDMIMGGTLNSIL